MKVSNWYFRMQQAEVEQFKEGEHFERLIYEAIKSYSGNAKHEVALSIREIANRATTAKTTVHRLLPKLITKKMIEITGESKRVGGAVKVFKVSHVETLTVPRQDTYRQESVPPGNESVPKQGLSVPTAASKPIQPNKPNNLIEKEEEPFDADEAYRFTVSEAEKGDSHV